VQSTAGMQADHIYSSAACPLPACCYHLNLPPAAALHCLLSLSVPPHPPSTHLQRTASGGGWNLATTPATLLVSAASLPLRPRTGAGGGGSGAAGEDRGFRGFGGVGQSKDEARLADAGRAAHGTTCYA
jgi:hypothetical protein